MNELLLTIANDLSILSYRAEGESNYCYRVCYSALAYWLLTLARGSENGQPGVSKKAQTDTLQKLLDAYKSEMGLEINRFVSDSFSYCQHIREVYEETGYLFTDNRNYSILANYGRATKMDGEYLYFGCPKDLQYMSGLGVYSANCEYSVSLFDAMIRDNLSCSDYIAAQYNPLDFDERDLELGELEFFNPTLRKSPSSSWEKYIPTNKTIARTQDHTHYYRVISSNDGKLLFSDCNINERQERLNAYEHRRQYIALKALYNAPVVAWINPIDDQYSEIRLSAQLPNREYYFLLLMAWPKEKAFEKNWFIAKNCLLSEIEIMLRNLGIDVRRNKYV